MKRMYLSVFLAVLCMNFPGCSDEDEVSNNDNNTTQIEEVNDNDKDKTKTEEVKDKDKTKIVEMTIYSETGYGKKWPNDFWSDAMIFSESDDNRKQLLIDIITEGFDFDYERGYEYTFEAKKVWMANPPQDVSSIKYQFIGPLTKKKVIVENSETEVLLSVASELVKYVPNFQDKNEDGSPKTYDALSVIDVNSKTHTILKEIEGFDYESGFKYTLSAKKIIQAEPYSAKYVLLEIKDKQKE